MSVELQSFAVEILDDAGKLVRTFSSDAPRPPVKDQGNIPRYWIRPPAIPSAEPGLHRFVWDLHGEAPQALEDARAHRVVKALIVP